MVPGFEKLIESRILEAKKKGEFDNLQGSGKPLDIEDVRGIPEDLRLSFKVLKNAGYAPPEIQIKRGGQPPHFLFIWVRTIATVRLRIIVSSFIHPVQYFIGRL
ncbi:MAG: DUF1992 domain-containing protein [FCB group bacterium]|nr:DUF1992 domain-containing protein [FCB group bacterium]